mmetsp:Transcript_30702/g.39593  ORF Transcript_30702/g.39593 Transcript_30702/m.39593 type:complete len:86 (+) Transcript_30702:1205-1462(+)
MQTDEVWGFPFPVAVKTYWTTCLYCFCYNVGESAYEFWKSERSRNTYCELTTNHLSWELEITCQYDYMIGKDVSACAIEDKAGFL